MNSITVFHQFLQILSHRVRTPLSVICNDLQYIQKVAPQLEAVRTLKSVGTATDLFNELEALSREIMTAVLNNDSESFFEIVARLLHQDGWQIVNKNITSLSLSTQCKNNPSSQIMNILEVYSDLFKKESLEVLLLASACADLNIQQRVECSDGVVTVFFKVSQ